MGLMWQKRKKLGKGTQVNLSGSGASVSKRVGPVSVSSRGNASVRLGKGLFFRKKLF